MMSRAMAKKISVVGMSQVWDVQNLSALLTGDDLPLVSAMSLATFVGNRLRFLGGNGTLAVARPSAMKKATELASRCGLCAESPCICLRFKRWPAILMGHYSVIRATISRRLTHWQL